jgi:hypothetical protein
MTCEQYKYAEHDLISRMQVMMERNNGVLLVEDSSSSDSDDDTGFLDDKVVRSMSNEREKATEEYNNYCNLCKMSKNRPRTYTGTVLRLGPADMRFPITMGKVATKGEDIRSNPPFVSCNLADFVLDDGRFNLLWFMELQKDAFPTLYMLTVCLSSIRTNEVGCERFFSMAGYVSCPRRTSLNVRNYECLAALRSNMKQVYIDEEWVVEKYLEMEKAKSWKDLDSPDDMKVLQLEQELLAESDGVNFESLPPIVVVVADEADDSQLTT